MSAKTNLSAMMYDRDMAMHGASAINPLLEYTELQYAAFLSGFANHYVTNPAYAGGASAPMLCSADPALPTGASSIAQFTSYVGQMTVSYHTIGAGELHDEVSFFGQSSAEATLGAAQAGADANYSMGGGPTKVPYAAVYVLPPGAGYIGRCERQRISVHLTGLSALYNKSAKYWGWLQKPTGAGAHWWSFSHTTGPGVELAENVYQCFNNFGSLGLGTEADSFFSGVPVPRWMFGDVNTPPGWPGGLSADGTPWGYTTNGNNGFILVTWTFADPSAYPDPKVSDRHTWNTIPGMFIVSRQPDDTATSDDYVYRVNADGSYTDVTPDASEFPAAPSDEDVWADDDRDCDWAYCENDGKWRGRIRTRPVNALTTPYEFIKQLTGGVVQPDGSYRYTVDFPEPIDANVTVIPLVALGWRTSFAVTSLNDRWLIIETGTLSPSGSGYYEQARAYIRLIRETASILIG